MIIAENPCEKHGCQNLHNCKCFAGIKIASIEKDLEDAKTPNHYDNSKGSIYKFCEDQNLNTYEFDLIKRIARCRKKGQFKEDLEKSKVLIDLYLKEFKTNDNE